MAEEGGALSVKERIAKLKLSQVGRVPEQQPPASDHTIEGTVPGRRRQPPPPPPRPDGNPRPSPHARVQSSNVPPTADHVSAANSGISNQPERGPNNRAANGMNGVSRPALPPRTSSQASQGPALPPRRPSESPALPSRRPSEAPSRSEYNLTRRGSNDSITSTGTATSSVSGVSNATSMTSQGRYEIKAPAYDPSSLPALPPKMTQDQKDKYYTTGMKSARRPLKSTYSTPNIGTKQTGTTPPPSRRPSAQAPSIVAPTTEGVQEEADEVEERPQMPPRPPRTIAPPPSRRSALDFGMNSSLNETPFAPSPRPGSVPQTNDSPPPVPTDSQPDLAAIQASKPKVNGNAAAGPTPAATCLHCRDFSGPDEHAARFPRESLPSLDIGWLANQLTAPFSSLTDKARALFTWQHRNIAYDTVAFFNNAVKPSTPHSTLETGLAVCEGYAGLFAAMAMKVGLEAVVIGGNSKGYGYTPLKPGDRIPPYNAGHAWNAVKIDGGQWKLIDCCWGAGAVNGKNQPYQKRFAPERFTQSNDDFGLDHFPGDNSKQFRDDGRVITWEEYITGNKDVTGAQHYSGYDVEEGINPKSFRPVANPIVIAQQGPTVRFSFQKICPHWDPVRCGKGPYLLYILHLDGLDGSPKQNIPIETNGDVWWCDVPTHDLGRPGQKASVWTVTSFNGRDPARGLTAQEFKTQMRSCGFGFVMTWEIA